MNLANFFRRTLTVGEDFASLSREIEICTLFLSIQKARYEDRLLVLIDVAPECEEILFPAFTLQPIVENAVNHGFTSLTTALKLEISAQLEQDNVVVKVLDNGGGFPAEVMDALKRDAVLKDHGIGLANINRRLKTLFGVSYALQVKNMEEGAQVEIRAPVRFKSQGTGVQRHEV